MKRALSLILVLHIAALLAAALSGCGKTPSARELIIEFQRAYGTDHTVYSPDVPEGEAGYIGEEFFSLLYSGAQSYVSDYAVASGSDLFSVSECAIFVCKEEYGAERVCLYLSERIKLLRGAAKLSGIDFPEGAFVKRYGKIAVMCVLADPARAERIFDKII